MAKRRILIVNVDDVVAREIEGRITGLGYEVAGLARSEAEAIAMRKEAAPEPVLTDLVVSGDMTDRELRAGIELALCKQDAANAVHELEDRFFAESIDMLCFLDFSGYFKRLNPAWERTLGFTRKELMSRPFIEFVHPDDRERTLKQNAHVKGGGQALAFENRYICKDGS